MSNNNDHDFALTSVAESQKRGFWSMFVIMMGFTFFSASMWAGGNLGAGLSLKQFIIAVTVGNLILGVYTSLLALMSARTGLSVHLLSRYSFGSYGSFIPSSALAFTQIGWFGVGVAMFAIPTAIALNDLPCLQGTWILGGETVRIAFDKVDLPARLLYIIVLASGLIMTSTAYWGIKALSIISIIAVPSIAVLGCYSAYCAMFVDKADAIAAAGVANGWELMKSYTPEASMQLTMAAAISIAIGSFISGGSCTPDFARFSRNSKIAVSTTALAFFIGNSLMFFFGAAGAMVWGISDISIVLKAQGLLGAAIIVLGLNIWTTNDNALYTSGLGLSNITKLPKKYLVLVNGIIGTLAAIWLYDNFCGWLNILNTFLPPVGALLITDFFIINRGKYKPYGEHGFAKVNISAVIAWALGSLVGLMGFGYVNIPCVGEWCKMGLPAINAMLTTLVVYVIAKSITAKSSANK